MQKFFCHGMHSVHTLLLVAVVFMASHVSPPILGGADAGGVQVTRFVCVHCTQTGQLSSRSLFLSRAAVHLHIAQAKACPSSGLGHREMPIQVQAVDVMA